MELRDMPPEVFSRIIHMLVEQAGVVEAWHSRAVCRLFRDFLENELFLHRPMADFQVEQGGLLSRNNRGTPARVLSINLGLFLFGRTKIRHDVAPELPNAIVEAANFLLDIDNISSTADREVREIQLIRAICNMVTHTQDWTSIVKSLSGRCLDTSSIFGRMDRPYSVDLEMTPHEQNLANKFSVATFFGNDFAINDLYFSEGARPWSFSKVFGSPLTVAALRGQDIRILELYLSMLPKNLKYSSPNMASIQFMLDDAISTLIDKKKFALATLICEAYARHASLVDKANYNRWLDDAIYATDVPLVSALLSIKQARNSPRMLYDHFARAIRVGHTETLSTLLKRGYFELNKFYHTRWPLREAIRRNNVSVVRVLLEHGAVPDGPDHSYARARFQHSPLFAAMEMNNLDMVNLLFEGGATVGGHWGRKYMMTRAKNEITKEIGLRIENESAREDMMDAGIPGRKSSKFWPSK